MVGRIREGLFVMVLEGCVGFHRQSWGKEGHIEGNLSMRKGTEARSPQPTFGKGDRTVECRRRRGDG